MSRPDAVRALGDGYALHASASGRAVVVTDITTPFWEDDFVEGWMCCRNNRG